MSRLSVSVDKLVILECATIPFYYTTLSVYRMLMLLIKETRADYPCLLINLLSWKMLQHPFTTLPFYYSTLSVYRKLMLLTKEACTDYLCLLINLLSWKMLQHSFTTLP